MRLPGKVAASVGLLCALASVALGATPTLMYPYSAGTGTTLAETSAGTAANATITPGASGAWDTSLGANKTGYNFAGTATSVTGSLSGTKVQTALAGSTHVTLEIVLDSAGSTSTYDGYFKLADGSDTGFVGLTINHAQGGIIFSAGEGASPNNCSIKYAIPTSGVLVLHIVIDTAQATAANRVLVFVNGSSVTPTILTQIGLNVALDTALNWSTAVLKMGESGASPNGKTYFVALYASALSSGVVAAHATSLAANNDADPNGTAATLDGFMFAQDWNWSPPRCVVSQTGLRWPVEVDDSPLLRMALPQALATGMVECAL